LLLLVQIHRIQIKNVGLLLKGADYYRRPGVEYLVYGDLQVHFVGLVGSGQVGVKVTGIEEEIVANEVDKREVGVV